MQVRQLGSFPEKSEEPVVHEAQAHEPANSQDRALQSVNIADCSQSVRDVHNLQRSVMAASRLMSLCCAIRISRSSKSMTSLSAGAQAKVFQGSCMQRSHECLASAVSTAMGCYYTMLLFACCYACAAMISSPVVPVAWTHRWATTPFDTIHGSIGSIMGMPLLKHALHPLARRPGSSCRSIWFLVPRRVQIRQPVVL